MNSRVKNILIWALCLIVAIAAAFGVRHFTATLKHREIKDTAANFSFFDSDSNEYALTSFRGKPTVVNFWAIWCPPCKNELPAFQRAYDELGDSVNFVFINVCTWRGDSPADVEKFLYDNGYTFPTFYDLNSSAANACNVSSIPLTLFLDANGVVKHSYNASIPYPMLKGYIDSL